MHTISAYDDHGTRVETFSVYLAISAAVIADGMRRQGYRVEQSATPHGTFGAMWSADERAAGTDER